jgi:hypothetical protein
MLRNLILTAFALGLSAAYAVAQSVPVAPSRQPPAAPPPDLPTVSAPAAVPPAAASAQASAAPKVYMSQSYVDTTIMRALYVLNEASSYYGMGNNK